MKRLKEAFADGIDPRDSKEIMEEMGLGDKNVTTLKKQRDSIHEESEVAELDGRASSLVSPAQVPLMSIESPASPTSDVE